MTTAAPTKAPPMRYPWRTALAITVALFGTLAAIWWYQDWAAERDFQAALAETDTLDPGWRLEDILAARPVIPDGQNSALIVAKVLPSLPPNFYSRGAPVERELQAQFERWPRNFQYGAPQIAALRKHYEPFAALRAEVFKLKDMPIGRLVVDYDQVAIDATRLPLTEHRQGTMFLRYDSMLRVADGDPMDIAVSCRALINLSRAIGDDPSIAAERYRIIDLLGATIDIEAALAQTVLPSDELRTLQQMLQREIEEPKFRPALRGERATGLRIVEAIHDGRIKPPFRDTTTAWRAWLGDWLPSSRSIDRAAYLRAMNELVEGSKLPMEDQIDAMQWINDAWKDRDAVLSPMIIMCTKTGIDAQFRSQATLRCAMVGIAAERYRRQRDSWPKSLETLVESGYIQAIPLDPYIGKPLRCRRLADGFLVYTVGADRVDNGGIINHTNPIAPGADIGFQLWDEDLRGLPAPVEPKGGS